jgi:hypothetical protein
MPEPGKFERSTAIIDEMSWLVADSVDDIAKDVGARKKREMTIPPTVVEMLFESRDEPEFALFAKAARIPAIAARVATQATAKLQLRAEMVIQLDEKGPMSTKDLVTSIFGADAAKTVDE